MKNNIGDVGDALKEIDDFILQNRMKLYINLKQRLPVVKNDEMRDYIDALQAVEDRMLDQINSMRKARNTAAMYNKRDRIDDIRKEREKQLSLRNVMDELF